ncbi:hypothetical protein [Nonomuraea sp. NPDC046570]|uniref:hypothetical protein n=1 Tax=Nonomuraea sp. NPDC046570 TaxID=3155255 RepID=UPI0033ED19E4
MVMAATPGTQENQGLDTALQALARAYADAMTVITATADVGAAFTGAAQIGDLLRELGDDLAARRANLTADLRKSLIQSAAPR